MLKKCLNVDKITIRKHVVNELSNIVTYTDRVATKTEDPQMVRDLVRKLKDNRFFSVFWGKGSSNLELIRSSTDIFKVLAERDLFKLEESDGEDLLK